MPTEMLTKDERRAAQTPSLPAVLTEKDEFVAAAGKQAKRMRRLKIHVAAWVLGSTLITGLWALTQWQANGAFEHFGSHEGNPGDWNPTLWALAVGPWGLFVGIKALRVYFERPTTEAEVDLEVSRLNRATADPELRRITRVRLDRIRRLKFHGAAWVLGMIVLTPLWALIEWQDNGSFERLSNNSQPGSWDPWVLQIGGIWALGHGEQNYVYATIVTIEDTRRVFSSQRLTRLP